jgi:ankyrin repeat protein
MDAPDLKNEHLDIVQDLLQHGADVKARNASGRSALLFAAEHGRAEAAKLLLEKGADVNEADQKGIFPLYAAACRGHAELITLLAEKGANMKAALPGGQTPLMCASREGRMSAINVLVERGAAINAKTPEGIAALTEASRRGDLDAVKLLLEKGADPAAGYLPDSFIALNGKTIGIRARNNKISDLLKRIAVAASQDGYTINYGPVREQKTAITAQTAWNKVLNELARKTHLLLLVKDKTVFVLPYDPGAIKHEGN